MAAPFLQDVHTAIRDTVHLAVRDGMSSLYVERISGRESVPVVSQVGSRLPLHATGVGKVLLATGKFRLSADVIGSAASPHAATPPAEAPTAVFGRHLAATCMGCHRDDLGGGPIVGGDPSWPPAANLTPGPGGLGGWPYAQFTTALLEGKRPDGTALRAPMSGMVSYARKMRQVELEALWSYVRSLPPVAQRD